MEKSESIDSQIGKSKPSEQKSSNTKKTYQKKNFVLIGKFNLYFLVPASIILGSLALYLNFPFSKTMAFCIIMLLYNGFIILNGLVSLKKETLDEGDIACLIYAPGIPLFASIFILSVAIPWFGRDGLISMAKSINVQERIQVAKKLGNILGNSNLRDDRIIPTLLTLAADTEVDVRKQALSSLQNVNKDKMGVEIAKQRLQDSDWEVQAEWVLGELEYSEGEISSERWSGGEIGWKIGTILGSIGGFLALGAVLAGRK